MSGSGVWVQLERGSTRSYLLIGVRVVALIVVACFRYALARGGGGRLSRVGMSCPVPPFAAAGRSRFPFLSASCQAFKSALPQDHHLLYQQRNRLFRRVCYSIYQTHPSPQTSQRDLCTTRTLSSFHADLCSLTVSRGPRAWVAASSPSILFPYHIQRPFPIAVS